MPAPELGNQLTRKVKRGDISQGQAQKTARQRQTFKAAYGPDWREKVFGAQGAKGIGGPFGSGEVRARRSQALVAARAKLKGRVAPAQRASRKTTKPGERIYLKG